MIIGDFSVNLEYYKVFYSVAKLGSLTGAAEQLCLTQPTVTKAIQNLERQLDCALFVRTKRGVHLTQEGEILWKRVEPACRLLMAAEQELTAVRELEGGSLSIASTEMGFRTYVLPALERFTQDYPKVKIRFRNALTEAILQMLHSGEIDLALLHTPFPTEGWLRVQEIGQIEECFIAGPRFAALAEQTHTLAELQDYPMLSLPEGSATKEYAGALFRRYGLTYEPDIEVTTIELAVQAVRSGLGIAMLPWEHVQESVERNELFRIPLTVPPLERRACMITHGELPLSPAARVFGEQYLSG